MDRWTVTTASEAIRTGELTPVDLVEHCLKQIDRHEEKVRAWVFIDADGACAEAERLTAELKKGNRRGPLHGIPIGVKDIIDVFDWPTAAGSKLWAKSIARKDAEVVKRLRQAGAVFLGKTVTTAYASFDPSVTRNPWNLAKTPGGSSSGSAAAVACGMCLGALATQTGGSITRPASYCGVCAIKPTYGRVSVEGVVPLAFSMDHVGVMAGCANDLAILLQAMADVGGRVVDTWEVPEPNDYLAVVSAEPAFLEIGRLRGLFDENVEPPMRKALEAACDRLRDAGLTIVDCPLPAAFSEVVARHQNVMAVEAASFHEPRYRRHPDDYPPRVRSLIEEGLAASATEYARTKEHQKALKTAVLESFCEGAVSAITPAILGPAPDAATTGLPTFNSPWSYVGFPTVNIPIGWSDDGLPLAMQLVGRPWEEAELLQMAVWCENAIGFEPRQVEVKGQKSEVRGQNSETSDF
jgi:Asp-tRNA(Asn)/Glu-tRNA(Gln) amidotransferase A subunit family amidase